MKKPKSNATVKSMWVLCVWGVPHILGWQRPHIHLLQVRNFPEKIIQLLPWHHSLQILCGCTEANTRVNVCVCVRVYCTHIIMSLTIEVNSGSASSTDGNKSRSWDRTHFMKHEPSFSLTHIRGLKKTPEKGLLTKTRVLNVHLFLQLFKMAIHCNH